MLFDREEAHLLENTIFELTSLISRQHTDSFCLSSGPMLLQQHMSGWHRVYQANRLLFMLPLFHAASHGISLCNVINNQTLIIYPFAAAIPTAQVMMNALKRTTVDVALVPPTRREGQSPNPRQYLSCLQRGLSTLYLCENI